APDGELEAAVLALPGETAATAIAAAWALVDPDFDLAIAETLDIPAPAGVEEMVVVNYDEEDDDRLVQAVGLRHEGTVYVQIYRGDIAAIQRRTAQIQIINTGFKI